MKWKILILIPALTCCNRKSFENPADVARLYCSCLERQLETSGDSLANFQECEGKVYGKSRLMNIYIDFDNRDKYDTKTLDSAETFALDVRNMEDTLCYNKINFKKLKYIRQKCKL